LNGWEEGLDKQAVEEIKQHFGIVAEGPESKIEVIAEGHALLRVEMEKSIEEFRSEVREYDSNPLSFNLPGVSCFDHT